MQQGARIRPAVLAAKEKLAEGREKLRRLHAEGAHGIQLCSYLTDLVDTQVLDIYQAALADLGSDAAGVESELALVPNGGYGRRDLVPFSDLDLMLLRAAHASDRVNWLSKRLVQDLSDTGFHLGFCMRTPSEACSLALKDPTIFTSLVESRFLTGSVRLFSKYFERFRRNARRRCGPLMASIVKSRNDERRQYGETVYLLEPNVKRSHGGLRDIQLLRWIGFARYGECVPSNLMRSGVLSRDDRDVLRRALEFLLRLRNELHFHAGQAKDVLARSSQVRIAELFGYQGDGAVLPVEAFMRDYFHHTSEVGYTVAEFVATARQGSHLLTLLAPLFTHTAGPDYRVGPVHISATRSGLEKLRGNVTEVLRLMELSNLNEKWIDQRTWTVIRDSMLNNESWDLPAEAAQRFLALISQPGRLGALLRRLHQLRVLERIIPAMRHARCLLQFNEYHKYTVDEHSFRTVEAATEFIHDTGPLGEAYRSIKQKRTLHLAALVHDLGKGYSEDHSDVGRRLAQETAQLLGMPERETETLIFLVHRHLLLSHLAQRRDINDPQVPLQLAVEAGAPDALQMLYVLTCADLAAVGPGVLNDWKKELITELYSRAMRCISEGSSSPSERGRLQRRRASLLSCVGGDQASSWWKTQVDGMPANCLFYEPQQQLVQQLEQLRSLPQDRAKAWGRYLPDLNAVEYAVGALEKITPGIFHKLTGVLSSKGLQILSAEINTLPGGLVLDRFYVHDMDFAGEPPAARLSELASELVAALESPSDQPPTFRRLWNAQANNQLEPLASLPTRVHIDNDTSDQFTILDIYAHDRLGLLYTITRTLFELKLSVRVAKIGTYLDQVVDVFYVTDFDGRKLEQEERLAEVKQTMLDRIIHEPSAANS